MKPFVAGKKMWASLFVIVGLIGISWWQWQPTLAWYHVRQLTNTSQENREACARTVVELDEAALPSVLERLQNSDSIVCANMECALALLVKKWGLADTRTQYLIKSLDARFDEFSLAGQEKVVLLLTDLLQQDLARPLAPTSIDCVSAMLVNAERKTELRGAALLLAAELVESLAPGQWINTCRAMAERGLRDDRPSTRIAAIQLLRREPMRKDKASLQKVVLLLRDPEAAVRRAALIALATESDIVREESFLPLLHDEDPQVQYLGEMALRKRGLTDDDIKLARMISDKNPATRMRVLHYFHQRPELNLREWLRQLCQDPEPAVRAAAARAAADYPQLDLSPRLHEMAHQDPSETVRQNARYYLRQRTARAALE